MQSDERYVVTSQEAPENLGVASGSGSYAGSSLEGGQEVLISDDEDYAQNYGSGSGSGDSNIGDDGVGGDDESECSPPYTEPG